MRLTLSCIVFDLVFDAEQLIPILLGTVLVVLAFVVICSWLLIRYFKRRIGQKAYLICAVPPNIFVALAVAFIWTQLPNEGPPKVVDASKLPGIISRLPSYAPFSISGASYFDGNLYVTTNVGLVEVTGGKVAKLYQFQRTDSVVSGGWTDRSNHLLWISDDHSHELAAFDGKNWKRIKEPVSSRRDSSVTDALEGIRPIDSPDGFWLAAGGAVWKWNAGSNGWDQIAEVLSQPATYERINEIIGVLPAGKRVLFIVRHQPLPYLVKPGERFISDEVATVTDPTSAPLQRDADQFLADTWTVTDDAGYICTKDHRLIGTTGDRISQIDGPGPCEAVSTDDEWNLIASVKSKGVYRYTNGTWTLLAATPYPSGAGEYWTHLASSKDKLALALDAQPVVDETNSKGRDMHFTRNAPTVLWELKNGEFSQIAF